MVEIIMPEVSDEASISCWHFEEGDLVEEGDDLVEISMTSGNAFTIPSPASGVLTEVLYEEDDDVTEGDVIAIVEQE